MKVGVLEILSSFIAAGDLNYPSSVLNDPSRNPCQAILIALPSTSLSRNLAASGTLCM